MFKFIGEGFTSKSFYNADSFVADDGQVIQYINTSIATKYKNPHTGAESWDNMRVNFKGKIAEAYLREVDKGTLIHVEGILHERSFKDKKTGNTRYVHEVTVQSFRPLQKAKKVEKVEEAQASSNPLGSLSQEQISAIPGDVLKALLSQQS